jgi:transketolase
MCSKDAAVASRKLSEIALTKLVEVIPELVGGSADLTGSNLTRWKGAVDFQPVCTIYLVTHHSPLPNLVTGQDVIFVTESVNTPWRQ